jgi:hypothetical protein
MNLFRDNVYVEYYIVYVEYYIVRFKVWDKFEL